MRLSVASSPEVADSMMQKEYRSTAGSLLDLQRIYIAAMAGSLQALAVWTGYSLLQ